MDDNANLTFLCLVHQFPEPDMQLAPSEGVRDDIAQHKKDETGKSYMVWWKRREVGRGLSSMPPANLFPAVVFAFLGTGGAAAASSLFGVSMMWFCFLGVAMMMISDVMSYKNNVRL